MVTNKDRLLKKIPTFVLKNKNLDDLIAAIGNSFDGVDTVNNTIKAAIGIDTATADDMEKKAYAFNMYRYFDETDDQLRERVKETIDFWQAAGTLFLMIETCKRTEGVQDALYYNFDNHLQQQMSIIYTGAGTAATLTIASGILTTDCIGAPGDNVTYNLANASYDTLIEVRNALNATGVYTATLLGATTGSELSIWLQSVTAINIKTLNTIGGGFIADIRVYYDGINYTIIEVEALLAVTMANITPPNIEIHYFFIPEADTFIE